MEKYNINCSGLNNTFKTICWLLSVVSWLLFLITGWIAIFGKDYNIWTIPRSVKISLDIDWILVHIKFEGYPYTPIQIDEPFIYIIFILTLGISTAGFVIYLLYSIFIKTNSVFNGMMGIISRFHFIGFICASALFIIGEDINDSDNKQDLLIASLIFSIIGLFSLVLSHFKTIMEPWYASLLIKRGTFSCLIALFTYSICYTIYQIGISREIKNITAKDLFIYFFDGKSKLKDFINNCGTALPITIGVVNIGLSFALKDAMISCMNLLMFIGMTIFYYNRVDSEKKEEYFKNNGDGVIDIIMMVLSSVTIALLIFMNKSSILK